MKRTYPARRMIYQRDNEVYVVTYPANEPGMALRQLGRWAMSTELSFNWLDACRVANGIRRHATMDLGVVQGH